MSVNQQRRALNLPKPAGAEERSNKGGKILSIYHTLEVPKPKLTRHQSRLGVFELDSDAPLPESAAGVFSPTKGQIYPYPKAPPPDEEWNVVCDSLGQRARAVPRTIRSRNSWPIAVGVIMRTMHDGAEKIVLLRRRKDAAKMPGAFDTAWGCIIAKYDPSCGGFVAESPEEAALREYQEEAGAHLTPDEAAKIRLTKIGGYVPADGFYSTLHLFLIDVPTMADGMAYFGLESRTFDHVTAATLSTFVTAAKRDSSFKMKDDLHHILTSTDIENTVASVPYAPLSFDINMADRISTLTNDVMVVEGFDA